MSLIKIPRNIFQTWETKNISNELNLLCQTWRENNTKYTYFLFDDNEREQFIKKHFDLSVYNSYCRIIPGAFKADLWRYCILYIYGGIYIDIDTICLGNIDLFLNEDIEFMTPIDLNNCPNIGTHNLFNTFIASIPKHPILLECINRIVYNVENNIIPSSNLDFTGPGILGRSVNTFLKLNETTSFIGKEGIINNTIYLLKFEPGIEIVKDIYKNKLLFQNKNGNNVIQKIYDEEIKKINHIDWGKCLNPIRTLTYKNTKLPTIVTMFYDIREKENHNYKSQFNHNINRYIQFAKEFIFKLPYNLIIFTDDEKISKIITDERIDNLNKTYIFKKPFENTYYFKHLEKLKELQTKFVIKNGYIEHETPMYIILNNNKFDFMESAIELNPFKSSHFVWMDFGINHVAKNTELIHEWITKVPDKIKQLCINPYTETNSPKEHFRYIYHNMAGGLFSGSSQNLLKYCHLFKQKTEEIYNDNWYQIDEAVMTMVQRENPDLFDLFYGDYMGIVSNYLYPIHNIDLILKGSQKLIDYNKTKESFTILFYCLKYFQYNPNSNLVFTFIQQNIIVDYYNNNELLVDEIINLINMKLSSENTYDKELIHTLLNNNKVNIGYYKNKELINI
jgi:hypothetical protein